MKKKHGRPPFPHFALLSLALMAGLTGCTQTSSRCDPSGLCHPSEPLHMARPVLLRMQENVGELHPTRKDAYAFALIESGPYCQVFLPPANGPEDKRWQSLLWHELRHCVEGNYHG